VSQSEIAVLIPTLRRPLRVEPILASLEQARGRVAYRPLFIVSESDIYTRSVVEAAGADPVVAGWEPGRADYQRKVNLGLRESSEPWLFVGADDVRFEPGWADSALECAAATGAAVVGTNDLHHPGVLAGEFATHWFVNRAYAERFGTVDEPGKILHEGYWHNFPDNECSETAKARGAWAFCRESVVEHLHPVWGFGEMDASYTATQAHFHEDAALYRQREKLWAGLSTERSAS
jgi:hypothetical protein